MISRIVRVKPSLSTVIGITSNFRSRRFSKEASPTLHKSSILQGYVSRAAERNSNTRYNNPRKYHDAFYSSSTTTTSYQPELIRSAIRPQNRNYYRELNSVQFEKISNDTLESLTEYFDELIEQAAHLPEADVSYGDGVLTVKFGKREGTYVINRQSPNKQIWLSSPKSGPKRYDFVDGKWVYKHDGKTLHDLLNREIPAVIRNQATFEKCSYSGMEQYVDRNSPNSFPD